MPSIIKKDSTNAAAIRNFFGRKPGQDLKGFMEEYKQLSAEEVQELGDTIRAQEGV